MYALVLGSDLSMEGPLEQRQRAHGLQGCPRNLRLQSAAEYITGCSSPLPCALAAAMETALATAAASVPADIKAPSSPGHGSSEQQPQQPTECALCALSHLAPGRLGLERSAALRSDLEALRCTDLAAVRAAEAAAEAGGPGAASAAPAASPEGQSVTGEPSKGVGAGAGASGVAGGGRSAGGSGEGKGKRKKAAAWAAAGEGEVPEAGAMARSYAQQLARLGRVAAEGETQQVGCWARARLPRVLRRRVGGTRHCTTQCFGGPYGMGHGPMIVAHVKAYGLFLPTPKVPGAAGGWPQATAHASTCP